MKISRFHRQKLVCVCQNETLAAFAGLTRRLLAVKTVKISKKHRHERLARLVLI